MNRFYQGDWIDSMASRFIDELPENNLEKNSYFDESKDTFEEFEFNQDFELDDDSKEVPVGYDIKKELNDKKENK